MNFRRNSLLILLATTLLACPSDDSDDDNASSETDPSASSSGASSQGTESGSGDSQASASETGPTRELYNCVSVADCSDGSVEMGLPICSSAGGAAGFVSSNTGCELACASSELVGCISSECEPTGESCECDDPDSEYCDADGGTGDGSGSDDSAGDVSAEQCTNACESFDRCDEEEGNDSDVLVCTMVLCPGISPDQADCLIEADGDCDLIALCINLGN